MLELRAAMTIIHITGLAILIGGLSWFVWLEWHLRAAPWDSRLAVDRSYRDAGDIFGVTLALTIYSGLTLYYLIHESFSWGFGTHWETWQSLKALLFLGFWVHWGWTEVVTMDRVRKMAPSSGEGPSEDYQAARLRGWRAVRLLSLEGVTLLILGAISTSPWG